MKRLPTQRTTIRLTHPCVECDVDAPVKIRSRRGIRVAFITEASLVLVKERLRRFDPTATPEGVKLLNRDLVVTAWPEHAKELRISHRDKRPSTLLCVRSREQGS